MYPLTCINNEGSFPRNMVIFCWAEPLGWTTHFFFFYCFFIICVKHFQISQIMNGQYDWEKVVSEICLPSHFKVKFSLTHISYLHIIKITLHGLHIIKKYYILLKSEVFINSYYFEYKPTVLVTRNLFFPCLPFFFPFYHISLRMLRRCSISSMM